MKKKLIPLVYLSLLVIGLLLKYNDLPGGNTLIIFSLGLSIGTFSFDVFRYKIDAYFRVLILFSLGIISIFIFVVYYRTSIAVVLFLTGFLVAILFPSILRKKQSELDTLRKQHKSGKTKSYTVAEVRKHAYSKLKK